MSLGVGGGGTHASSSMLHHAAITGIQDAKSLSFLLLFETPVDMVLNALGCKHTLAMRTGHTAQGDMPLVMVVDKTRGVACHEGQPLAGHTRVSTALAACCSFLLLLSSFISFSAIFLARTASATSCCQTLRS